MLVHRRFLPLRLALAAVALLAIQLSGLSYPASAEISGSTYTSDRYRYTLTWDDTWFAVEEFDEQYYDGVTITNGLTYATVFGEDNVYASLEAGMASNISGLRSDPSISNYSPMRDAAGNSIRGGDDERQFAAVTYTYTYEDGSSEDLAAYVEVRVLEDLNVFISLLAVTLVDSYGEELPSFQNLLDGLNADGPTTEPSDPVAGEPGPVFVSGPWRIAVATSAVNADFADLGLKEKADKEWLLVVLDVTNWSDDDAELKASHFTVALAGEAKPVKIARSSLQGVAEALALAPFSEEQTLAVDADETVRVVLAFVLPAGSAEPHLAHRETAIPIEDTIELDLTPAGLPALALSPEISEGEIVSASDGRTMRIALDGESKADRIQLLGVEPADEGSCFENEAENVLDDLAGANVLVEEDAAVSGGDAAVRYVWLLNDDGTRTLLNQLLLATGAARADGIPGDARFGSWLETTALGAEEAGIGLWGDC